MTPGEGWKNKEADFLITYSVRREFKGTGHASLFIPKAKIQAEGYGKYLECRRKITNLFSERVLRVTVIAATIPSLTCVIVIRRCGRGWLSHHRLKSPSAGRFEFPESARGKDLR